MNRLWATSIVLVIVLRPPAFLRADVVVRRWSNPKITPAKDAAGVVRLDLGDLPARAKIHRADLRIFRTASIDGRNDAARISIEIYPLFAPAATKSAPLKLRPLWYDRFDATATVASWASGKVNGGFLVKACPLWNAQATCLDVTYEGKAQAPGPQVKQLNVLQRAGVTFITFQEIDDRSAAEKPTWGQLKAKLERMDTEREVRYAVYRSGRRITAATLANAELLGEVKPMSGYNVRGRSVDRLIAAHRRRAVEDLDFARKLARGNYFARYSPDMAEMADVPIDRLAVTDARPLAPRLGLYAHHPAKAGKAYYAVATVVDGAANTRDFSEANSLVRPVTETVGPGRPVLQGEASVTVFYDSPGKRLGYVQWAAPPLSHLPNQYYNWGVFVPKGYDRGRRRRLSVFFHDARQRFGKPPWPARADTVLLSPHDGPWRAYGYGYHEALGTLRSFGQGKVRPFFALRVDAMLEWAVRTFGADAGRISCAGSGYWGGTAALQYGMRRPGRIAYVLADNSPDPDPRDTPYEYSHYGRGDRRKTRRANMDAVWGPPDWAIPAESGKSIWQEMDLPAYVLAEGERRTLPFLSLGAGGMHLTWKQETDLMKACLKTNTAFMAVFFWGGKPYVRLPTGPETGEYAFEPRCDRPVLACSARSRSPNPAFFAKHFDTGKRGYGGGSRLGTRPRWDPDNIVETPDRLEMTIYTARRVTYAGTVTCDTVVRNTRKFRPRPGEKLSWTVTGLDKRKVLQKGSTSADKHGRIPIEALRFAQPARLVIRRTSGGEGSQ